ncbi:MAG: adenosylcobinamide amidohydrolase [Nitrososphaerota archaeon]|nr:adenosylcobinamide amidohydrolase [Nitrososphaerota archaeon]
MEEFHLTKDTKLFIRENVLAIICDNALKTISSAIFNGGSKQVRAVLNVGVPEGYSDLSLHLDPLQLIVSSAAKVGIAQDYLAMVTAAKIKNYSLVSKRTADYTVCVVATAGCSHGESSGENMAVDEITGTINIIVFIEGNPTESCMVAALITATEAKSAALRDFDVRSRYTGDSATGSITDAVTIASTGRGREVVLGGPASKLGKLVGYCARRAVTEALLKQEPIWANRSVFDRLEERHLSLEKLSSEVSKVEGLVISTKELAGILRGKPQMLAALLAAVKMDDDYNKNLLPSDFKTWEAACQCSEIDQDVAGYGAVNLPPFVRAELIKIIKATRSTS